MNPVEFVDVDGVAISRDNLCGLVWACGLEDCDVYLRAYIIDRWGDLDYVTTFNTDTQSALFAIAGYRPYNPWKDGSGD